jgi:phosphoribosylamine---glycine ligase
LKVLVLGGGGREHALAWRLAQCASVSKIFAAPGNPGIARQAELAGAALQPAEALALAEALSVDVTVVGPEAPLVAGVADLFHRNGRAIVGPTQAAAQLEGSKIFCKELMEEAGIPTARFAVAGTAAEALRALAKFEYPLVLKADGLAAGKGVVVARDRAEAERTIDEMFSGALVGDAGKRLVIEDFLPGTEVSFIVLSDGETVRPLAPSQDHKAIFDGDRGPNTGGMGAYSDDSILNFEQTAEIVARFIRPAVDTMARRGTPFGGFLYAGLMMTAQGPRLLEFNVRLGDPECQALMHRLDCDFGEVLAAAAQGELHRVDLTWRPEPSVCVVLAAEGYPGTPRTGDVIFGLEEAESTGAVVFQAGTRFGPQGVETAGGRVLGVTARGNTLRDAIDRAYAGVAQLRFAGMQFRRDIGAKGLR